MAVRSGGGYSKEEINKNTDRELCLLYSLMCRHIQFMKVSALVFVLKLCQLFCERCTQISECLDCNVCSHLGVCYCCYNDRQ